MTWPSSRTGFHPPSLGSSSSHSTSSFTCTARISDQLIHRTNKSGDAMRHEGLLALASHQHRTTRSSHMSEAISYVYLYLASVRTTQHIPNRTFSLPPVPRLLKAADSPPLAHRLKRKASVEASIIARIKSILPPLPATRAPAVLLLEPSTIEPEQ